MTSKQVIYQQTRRKKIYEQKVAKGILTWKHLSDHEKWMIKKMRKDKESYAEIARVLNRALSGIYQYCKKNGL